MGRARVATTIVLLLGVLACEPTTSPPSCRGHDSHTTHDIAYASVPGVDPNLLALDLTVPERSGRCGPAPVVIWVHGGSFSGGDKDNGVATMARWATEQGWAFASVNYRLSPRPPTDDPDRVLHPTHVSDIATAVGWLDDHAVDLDLDPDRLLLVGHSAGALLVSLLATDGSYLAAAGVELDQVRAVAPLDTRYDIAAEVTTGNASAEAAYRNAFGDDPDVWHDASPLTHAGTDPAIPPFVVVTRGQADRIAGAEAFAAALDEATVVDARPMSHEEVGDVLGRADDDVVTPVVTDAFRDALDRPMVTRR